MASDQRVELVGQTNAGPVNVNESTNYWVVRRHGWVAADRRERCGPTCAGTAPYPGV